MEEMVNDMDCFPLPCGSRFAMTDFFSGKRVFLTGHTGFKGAWLSRILLLSGAEVTEYALEPPTEPSLWELLRMESDMRHITGDVRDLDSLRKAFDECKPEIVFHMAAQPLVREGYKDPVGTYATNVMGTVNILECARLYGKVDSFINITTDKVYRNNEWLWGYREDDILDGYDPYSNSKSCSELVTATYIRSFKTDIPISSVRSGNVIGGGDFAKDRIIPDCVRAMERREPIVLRNPHSIRPYQHVLEALGAYLMIAERQCSGKSLASCYNVGPNDCDCVTTGTLADIFCKSWGEGANWEDHSEADAPHEAGFLKLDCQKLKTIFEWQPKWDISEAVSKTVEWEKVRLGNVDDTVEIRGVTDGQITKYFQ